MVLGLAGPAVIALLIIAGLWAHWCDPKKIGVESPESIVAAVEDAVATVVERSLREDSASWEPVKVERYKLGAHYVDGDGAIHTHTVKEVGGLAHPTLELAIHTLDGPGQCVIFMREDGLRTRKIELQPVQRARIWGAAKLVLDNHAAAERIEALTDVVERIGGVKK